MGFNYNNQVNLAAFMHTTSKMDTIYSNYKAYEAQSSAQIAAQAPNSVFAGGGAPQFNVNAAAPAAGTSQPATDNGPAPEGKVKDLKGNGYGPEFLAKVKQIAQRVNCDYRDLLAVMNSESGINSTAVNKSSGATGLIQFMPSTARGMGTSTSALKAMTPIQQLDYVERFLLKNKAVAGFASSEHLSGGQLYALVFLPARAKRQVLTQAGEKFYNANKGLDLDKDGKISIQDLDLQVRKRYVSDKSFTG